jgi:glycerol uptake facilitator-like aquaporin
MIATRIFAAEFIGTMLLLTVVVGSGIMGESLAAGNAAVALLANSLATGAALIVLIWVFGSISGAHFNPVVSLVFRLRGDLTTRSLVSNLTAQFLGAAAGVVLAHAMFDLALIQPGDKVRTGTGQWLSECVATFGLLLVILACVRRNAQAVAVAVGLYIVAAYWFTASTSFANPAVTLARSLTTTFAGIRLADVAPFMGAQLLGAWLAWRVERWLAVEQK